MIRAQHLTKRYGHHTAIDDLNFEIEKGEILGFLGPNGAGKTTVMNIITGYLSASDGWVAVDGLDVLEHPEKVKSKIGYLPEQPPLYPDMTVSEYLKFTGELKKVSKHGFESTVNDIMDVVKISDVRGRLIKNLSKGYRQRVGLAQALIGNPELLILDEPTVGLDPKQIIEIRNLIKQLGKEHTILLSSHILPEVSAVCERVIIIDRGRIVASDTPENLGKRLASTNQLLIRIQGAFETASSCLEKLKGIEEVYSKGSYEPDTVDLVVRAGKDYDIRGEVSGTLTQAGLQVLMMRPIDMTLEEIFLHLTTQEQGE